MDFVYALYTKKADGSKTLVSERRSPFSPDDERGKTAIANYYRLFQRGEFTGAHAVALTNQDGTKTWFNRNGHPVDEERAFRV